MSAPAKNDALLARQPVYETSMEIWGYELLFRDSNQDNSAKIKSGDSATSEVLLNAFEQDGLDSICGQHPALINFTKNLILDLPPFDPKHFIIEILEDIEVDDNLIQALTAAKKAGARLALDDFVLNHNSAPLLHLADIIKVDVLGITREQIQRYADVFLPRKMIMLAEKVETHEMFEFCKDLGYTLFQGYFLSRPQIIQGKKIPSNKLVVLNLLKELQNPDIHLSDLATTLSVDPQLSYKLLTMVNSAAFARVAKCSSLQQAVAAMGLNMVKSWASLIALGKLDDKPLSLSQTSLERANFCQAMGKTLGEFDQYDYYTVGLFSLLDAYLDIPITEVLEKLHLDDIHSDAILKGDGKLGLALKIATCYQQGKLEDLDEEKLAELGLDQAQLNEHYRQAISVTDELIKEIR